MNRLLKRTGIAASTLSMWCLKGMATAAVYDGGGIDEGVTVASDIVGGERDLRAVVLDILFTVLAYMGLAATVVIIIAGILLVVSGGEETNKDRAKRMIFYTLIGLIVILLAEALVLILINAST
jgi:hypothetical protein